MKMSDLTSRFAPAAAALFLVFSAALPAVPACADGAAETAAEVSQHRAESCVRLALFGIEKCSSCGKLIVFGKMYRLEDGRVICPSCNNDSSMPRCIICGIPIRKGGTYITNDEWACSKHAQEALKNQKDSDRTDSSKTNQNTDTSNSNYILTGIGLIEKYVSPDMELNPDRIKLHLLSQGELKAELTSSSYKGIKGELRGITKMTTDSRGAMLFSIYILKGQSEENFMSDLCHELGHVWQDSQPKRIQPDMRRSEGFCEWVAYKVNSGLGRKKMAAALLNKRISSYREGLRDCINIEKSSGTEGVLRYATGEENGSKTK